MSRLYFAAVAGLLIAALSACAPSGDSGGSSAPSGSGSSGGSAAASDPKATIAAQLEALKAGDVEKVKEGMTARVRDDVTPEIVAEAKGQAEKMPLDEVYASAEMGEDGGKKTAKVKMKNGRTLTTLIEEDGKWRADTVWFK